MYREYPVFDCPCDTEKVWRYMKLSCFLWMLRESKLYFARLLEFSDDPYEGTLPHVNAGRVEDVLKAAYGFAGKLAAVNCWHMNEFESAAMWKLYVPGGEGVAIQSTIGRLKAIQEDSDFVIGRVKYIDYESAKPVQVDPACRSLQPYMLLFQKRNSYRHEQEVRVVILNPADMPRNPGPIPSERNAGSRGFGVPVSLANLVEKVVVSPDFSCSSIETLKHVVECAGLRIHVEKSDLLKPPNRECEEALGQLIKMAGRSGQ